MIKYIQNINIQNWIHSFKMVTWVLAYLLFLNAIDKVHCTVQLSPGELLKRSGFWKYIIPHWVLMVEDSNNEKTDINTLSIV